MTEIIWKSEERIIPNYGVASTGDPIILPDDLAQKFIEQGEAEAVKRGDQKSLRTNSDEVI